MKHWPGIIPIVGHASIWLAFALIGYRVGLEVAIYHRGKVERLAEAAQLRWDHWHGREPMR